MLWSVGTGHTTAFAPDEKGTSRHTRRPVTRVARRACRRFYSMSGLAVRQPRGDGGSWQRSVIVAFPNIRKRGHLCRDSIPTGLVGIQKQEMLCRDEAGLSWRNDPERGAQRRSGLPNESDKLCRADAQRTPIEPSCHRNFGCLYRFRRHPLSGRILRPDQWQVVVEVVAAVRAVERQGSDEHGEEAVAMDHLRHAIRHAGHRESASTDC